MLVVSVFGQAQTTGSDGQMTVVVGEITDERTGEPIEGVSVYLRGTPYGTSTTKEGVFLLRAMLRKRTTMVVSAVGYKTQTFSVEAGRQAGIDVVMREESSLLEEVFVVPGSNPALALMDSVRVKSLELKTERSSGLEVKSGRETAVYLSDIKGKHLRRRLWKSLRGVMVPKVSGDSAMRDTTFLIPVYNSRRGEEKATDGVWKVFLGDMDESANFYHSTVTFCGTAFLSPVAMNSDRYYYFELTDSVYENKRKTYEVKFRTRNPYYATFNGMLWVDSASYSLKRVEAEAPEETNVNYLRHLNIEQEYDLFDKDLRTGFVLVKEQVTEILDVAVKSDTTHFFPTLMIQSEYQLPESAELMVDNADSAVENDGTATIKSGEYMRDEIQRDSVAASPILRVGHWLARLALTGYIPTGTAVDIGKVTEILRINNWEKARIGLPLRTNAKMSERVCLEGYAAYGFGDRQWKGMGRLQYQLPTERRHIIGVRYGDEYVARDADYFTAMRMENNAWYKDRSLTSHWTEPFNKEWSYKQTVVRRREMKITSENDWGDGVESYGHIALGREADFWYTQVGATVRLSWGEKKADLYFQRVYVYNNKPVVYVNGEIGSVHHFGKEGYDMYGKLRLMVRQRVDLGMAGRLDYLAEAGWLIGKVPESMGYVFAGNDSYAFDPYSFTLMHRGQYGARRYISAQAEWNGRGCLLNRIKGVQRLRLRELAVGKVAYGGDLQVPYVELGVGIGNILRVADLYAVFRVTRQKEESNPWWGVRLRLRVES